MQEKYEEVMQEVEKEISAIDLNGKHIIKDCKAIIVFLRDKLTGLKADIQSIPFSNSTEEIAFFKDHKPMLLGRLIYFHEILRIESQRPLGEDTLDEYYEKQQEEQKIFSTVMCPSFNITAAEPPIWTSSISCAEIRKA